MEHGKKGSQAQRHQSGCNQCYIKKFYGCVCETFLQMCGFLNSLRVSLHNTATSGKGFRSKGSKVGAVNVIKMFKALFVKYFLQQPGAQQPNERQKHKRSKETSRRTQDTKKSKKTEPKN